MKKLYLIPILVSSAHLWGSQLLADNSQPEDSSGSVVTQIDNDQDIVDTAISSGFSTLASALTSAGLVETLRGDGPFTVFAPTDAAFAALPAGTLESLTAEQLVDILTYHVVAGEVLAADVMPGPVSMVNGDSALITVDGESIAIDGANISATDIITTNGVIHVIESVMLPPTDIVDTAISSGFSTLASALTSAGLVETLQGDGPFTVFAPTDAAFAALPAGTLESLTAEQLVDILTYHVVAGEVLAADVMPGPVSMVNGDSALITVDGESIAIDGANISATDIITTNGVIHVIESVMLPPTDIVDTAISSGFSTLASALTSAGLVETLQGDGPFTVFAPTDDAFAKLPDSVLENLTVDQLIDILTYHVFPAEVFSGDVTPGPIEMLNGTEAILSADNEGNLYINDAQIVMTDVIASNGVIHVISDVIAPFNITLPWAGLDPETEGFSPWFGAFTVSENNYINHFELGWLYVGAVENAESMWFYSIALDSWIWTNESHFPVFYNASTSSYIYYFIIEEFGFWIYDFSTGLWTASE